MNWIIFVTVITFGGHVTSQQIPFYGTEKECILSAEKIKKLSSGWNNSAICIPQESKK